MYTDTHICRCWTHVRVGSLPMSYQCILGSFVCSDVHKATPHCVCCVTLLRSHFHVPPLKFPNDIVDQKNNEQIRLLLASWFLSKGDFRNSITWILSFPGWANNNSAVWLPASETSRMCCRLIVFLSEPFKSSIFHRFFLETQTSESNHEFLLRLLVHILSRVKVWSILAVHGFWWLPWLLLCNLTFLCCLIQLYLWNTFMFLWCFSRLLYSPFIKLCHYFWDNLWSHMTFLLCRSLNCHLGLQWYQLYFFLSWFIVTQTNS